MDRIEALRAALTRVSQYSSSPTLRQCALDALNADNRAAIAQDAAQMEDRDREQNRLWAEMDAELRIDPATERR